MSDKKHDRLVLATAQYAEHFKLLSNEKEKEFEKVQIMVSDMKNSVEREVCSNWKNYLALEAECNASRLKWNQTLAEAEGFRNTDGSHEEAANLLGCSTALVDAGDSSIDLTSPVPTKFNNRFRSETPHSEMTGLSGVNDSDSCDAELLEM